MAAVVIPGQTTWEMTRDELGYREYHITYYVRCASTDGPATALAASGLPAFGSTWSFGSDTDAYAWCRFNAKVTPLISKEPNKLFSIEFTFSSKPLDKCQLTEITDPLAIPPKVSGSFTKYQEEATADRFGKPLMNSAFELLKGHQIEFDHNRQTVKIEQNLSDMQLPLVSRMMDTLNIATLWGLPPGTIKLSGNSWERKFYGACSIYYTRTLDFDIRYDGFDRDILDEGTKVLCGHWNKATGKWVVDNVGTVSPAGPPVLVWSTTGGHIFTNPADPSISVRAVYGYRIATLDDSGETLAGPPSSILINGTTNKITLSWLPIHGATSYNLFRAGPIEVGTAIQNTDWSFLANTAATSYIDTEADPPGPDGLPTSNTTGKVAADPKNPLHFQRFQDFKGNPTRVILNGAGLPAGVPIGPGTSSGTVQEEGKIHVEYYGMSDFTLLGIPTSF